MTATTLTAPAAPPRPGSRAARMALPRAVDALKQLASEYGVCIRPIALRRTDLTTGQTELIDLPCGATLDVKCPPCAKRARHSRPVQIRELLGGDRVEGRDDRGPGPEERRGFFRRLRENLSKTRVALQAEVQATLFQGDLDEETWERLEEALIYADVGARTTAQVVEQLEREAEEGDITGGEALTERLSELLAELAKTGDDHIDLRPELYTHHYRNEFPERFLDQMDTRRWGPGERIVFEPYTKEVFEDSFKWIREHKIFDPADMGSGKYEEACTIAG